VRNLITSLKISSGLLSASKLSLTTVRVLFWLNGLSLHPDNPIAAKIDSPASLIDGLLIFFIILLSQCYY